MLRRVFAIALALSLAACSTISTKPVTDWQRFAERQQQLSHWELVGKLGLKSPRQKSGSASIKWQQQQQGYEVRLSGLGIATTYIYGDAQRVVMKNSEQQHAAASSEELTGQLLGVPLSVEDLTYWVRGIPAPDKPVLASSHDSIGALQTLAQDGWHLQFSKYTEADGWLLPGMIRGQRGELSFTLRIKSWKPEAKI